MKISNRILLLMLIAILTAVISFSFYLEPYLQTAPNYEREEEILHKKQYTNWKTDTLEGTYHYIWTNFPEVQVDPLQEGIVRKLAYENAADRSRLEIRNDTLFVYQNPSPNYAKGINIKFALRDTTTQIIVGAKKLKGVEAVDRGRITHYRGDKNGFPGLSDYFRASNANVPPLKNDAFDINLKRGGDAVLNVEANTVNVNLSEQAIFHTYTRLRLRGIHKRLYFNHRDGKVDVKTHNAQTDSVFVDTQAKLLGQKSLFRVYADKYLQARIKGKTNVMYLGNPIIKKKEFHSGRVIDGNFYK